MTAAQPVIVTRAEVEPSFDRRWTAPFPYVTQPV